MFGGRWNPPDTVATIYLASSEECAEAELRRLLDGQARGVPAQSASVGPTPEDLVDDDWTACQVVGNAVHYLGFTALFAPSATGVGDIIAVYEPHLRPDQLTIVESVTIPRPPRD